MVKKISKMNNQYQHNGKSYTLKPLTLGVLKKIIPLLVKLRKLQHEYTKDIDMSDVNKSRRRLNELEEAKKQLTVIADNEESNEKRIEAIEKISKLNDKISAHRSELENNESFQNKIKLFNECPAFAIYEIITNIEIIKPVIEAVLEGDAGQIEINFEDPETIKFITRMITDFFLLIQKNKLKLSG